jgi:hypothetical protein
MIQYPWVGGGLGWFYYLYHKNINKTLILTNFCDDFLRGVVNIQQRADTAEPEEGRILRIEWMLLACDVRKTDRPENIDPVTFMKMSELLRAN